MRSKQTRLLDSISDAFPVCATHATLSLRQGDEIDSYNTPPPDIVPADWRNIPDGDLEAYHWGFTHLDTDSWRFYLPAFLAYSIRHMSCGESLVIHACLGNLRPPDRIPARFNTLNDQQRRTVVGVLEFLAFDCESGFAAAACQVLEEYWIKNPFNSDT
ncbi:hypothetical protein M2103_000750 [Ereboglobus sp. PH5-5]|uniref:DUF6714 family protein n=1 Tax=Ereboglobus sp. PH5-5 TaxID=2940529 RepID=UPI0024069132|nr:DUF6714 family protein [Ereboglobus sp. PH5-5]MDF9832540.1 hypothetical protein [Ereboglobus sp. PH5-5]